MPNDDWQNDYHSIWLYIPESKIASDPIKGNSTPGERLELAIRSAEADELAAAPEHGSKVEQISAQVRQSGSSCLETIVIFVIGLAVILWWMSQYNAN